MVVLRDDCVRMSDEHPSEVLGGLRHTRPHRRSEKRVARAAAGASSTAAVKAPKAAATAAPREVPPATATAAPREVPPVAATAAPRAVPPATATRSATTPIAAPRTTRRATPAAAPGATKRATRSTSRVRQPAQPPGTPPAPSRRRPTPAGGVDLLGSAVHVSAELAEIGISAGARALRGVVARLPRP